MRSPTLPPPNNAESEKIRTNSSRTNKRTRRGILFAFFTLALFCFLYFPVTVTTTASIWTKIKSLAGCGSTPMSTHAPTTSTGHHHGAATSHSAVGWHTRATRTSASGFAPKKTDLVFTALINSQVEPDGFTMALVRPHFAVDASGHLLTLSAADFTAFEHAVTDVKSVEDSGGFMGQWRVKQARTSYPIDEILIPGEKERAVYGWAKGDGELELEEETKGHTTLPKALQVIVGLAKEARDGYVRGQKDESVIAKVRALE